MRLARLCAAVVLVLVAVSGCAHQSAALQGAPGGALSAERPGEPAAVTAPGEGSSPEKTAARAAEDGQRGTGGGDEGGEGPAAEQGQVSDPLAPWNRAMFAFNDRLYFWVLKPVSRGYRAVVPPVARRGVRNFFHNLTTPGRLVSDLLQFKGREAAVELGKFMINTSWGVLGFGDWFAANPEAKIPEEDLGLTLGSYGFGNGCYIVWPFLGPSTLRDSVGLVGDVFLDPTSYVQPTTAAAGIYAYREVNTTSFRIGDYEALKDAAIDPYIAVRQAYIQHRARATKQYEQPQNFIFP